MGISRKPKVAKWILVGLSIALLSVQSYASDCLDIYNTSNDIDSYNTCRKYDIMEGGDCIGCSLGDEHKTSTGVQLAGILAGPLAYLGVNALWSNQAGRDSRRRYNSQNYIHEQCTTRYQAGLAHIQTSKSNPASPQELAMMNRCNGMPMGGGGFAGMGGVYGNGFGGFSNPMGAAGWGSGFMSGMAGPYGGYGMMGSGGIVGGVVGSLFAGGGGMNGGWGGGMNGGMNGGWGGAINGGVSGVWGGAVNGGMNGGWNGGGNGGWNGGVVGGVVGSVVGGFVAGGGRGGNWPGGGGWNNGNWPGGGGYGPGPWNNGQGGYWSTTGGWADNNVNYNAQFEAQRQQQEALRRQQLEAQGVAQFQAGVARGNQATSRVANQALMQNYRNAAQDLQRAQMGGYYGVNNGGAMVGGQAYAAGNIGAYFSL